MRHIRLIPGTLSVLFLLFTFTACQTEKRIPESRDDSVYGYPQYPTGNNYDNLFGDDPNWQGNSWDNSGDNSGLDADSMGALASLFSGFSENEQRDMARLLNDYLLECSFLISAGNGGSFDPYACSEGDPRKCVGEMTKLSGEMLRTAVTGLADRSDLQLDAPIGQILQEEIMACRAYHTNDPAQIERRVERDKQACMRKNVRACISMLLGKIRMFLLGLVSILLGRGF